MRCAPGCHGDPTWTKCHLHLSWSAHRGRLGHLLQRACFRASVPAHCVKKCVLTSAPRHANTLRCWLCSPSSREHNQAHTRNFKTRNQMYGHLQHTDAQAVILLSCGHVVFFERVMFSLEALIHFEKTLPLETKRSAGATQFARGSASRVLRQISISTACPAQQLPIVNTTCWLFDVP